MKVFQKVERAGPIGRKVARGFKFNAHSTSLFPLFRPSSSPPLLPLRSAALGNEFSSESSAKKCFTSPLIKEILQNGKIGEKYEVHGWVRSVKVQKDVAFIHLEDGSSPNPLQLVATKNPKDFRQLTSGTSIGVGGTLIKSVGSKQAVELDVEWMKVVGNVEPSEYPLQPKFHSPEFLRQIAHLRPRTKNFGAVLRIRNSSAMSFHQFLQNYGFIQIHNPILTTNDCEGGGEVFRVTTLPLEKKSSPQQGGNEDFFGKPVFLTVSGQLHGEMMACALSRVYTFGPTFRAEPGITTKHLAEFTMLEPEMTHCNLEDCMDISEELVKFGIQKLFEQSYQDLELLHKQCNESLGENLRQYISQPFARVSFSEAVKILLQAQVQFQFTPSEEADLQTEHEKYLSEVYFKRPVFVYNWPKVLKPFYMRQNEDKKTVAAMDLLVPGVGELIGGSAREERYERLQEAINKTKLDNQGQLNWYLDLRKFGTVPHAGFGLGFERFIQFVTGINNIRDVVPLPRYNKHCDY